jgi:hypothetical protein
VEWLSNLQHLATQKPSELLAEVMCLCPRGQENNAFFKCFSGSCSSKCRCFSPGDRRTGRHKWRQCVLGSAAVTVVAGTTARGNEPAFVKREVQDFGGRHAATPLSSGGHPGDSSPFPNQRATSFPRNCQLLQEIPAQCPDELCCDKKWLERLEWLVTMEAAFAAAKQTLLFATHLAHPTVRAALSLVLDASPMQEGLAAPGILL